MKNPALTADIGKPLRFRHPELFGAYPAFRKVFGARKLERMRAGNLPLSKTLARRVGATGISTGMCLKLGKRP